MALRLSELVTKIESLRHTRSIWQEVIDHLSTFIDLEVRKATQVIVSEGSSYHVPQSAIKSFIERLVEQELSKIDREIERLESVSLQEKKDDQGDGDSKRKEEEGKGAKEGPKENSSRGKGLKFRAKN